MTTSFASQKLGVEQTGFGYTGLGLQPLQPLHRPPRRAPAPANLLPLEPTANPTTQKAVSVINANASRIQAFAMARHEVLSPTKHQQKSLNQIHERIGKVLDTFEEDQENNEAAQYYKMLKAADAIPSDDPADVDQKVVGQTSIDYADLFTPTEPLSPVSRPDSRDSSDGDDAVAGGTAHARSEPASRKLRPSEIGKINLPPMESPPNIALRRGSTSNGAKGRDLIEPMAILERVLHIEGRLSTSRFAAVLKPAFEEVRQGLKELGHVLREAFREKDRLQNTIQDLKKEVQELESKIKSQMISFKMQITSLKTAHKEELKHAAGGEPRFSASKGPRGPPAPKGEVTLVCMAVENATAIWDADPDVMAESCGVLLSLCRSLVVKHNGYEVSAQCDSFCVAFHTPCAAVAWGLEVQSKAFSAKWPKELLSLPMCSPQTDDKGTEVWRGLRLQIGAHIGNPHMVQQDSSKVAYYGGCMNGALMLRDLARGGELVVTEHVHRRLGKELSRLNTYVVNLGKWRVSGVSTGSVELLQYLPMKLCSRSFPDFNSKPLVSGPAVHNWVSRMKREVEGLVKNSEELENRTNGQAMMAQQKHGPIGMVCFVQLKVNDCEQLWSVGASELVVALGEYHHLVQSIAADFKGYPARAECDLLTLAFSRADAAVGFAAALQRRLLELRLDRKLMSTPECAEVRVEVMASGTDDDEGKEVVVCRGLRVNCAIHYGEPITTRQTTASRVAYTGPCVDASLALLAHCRPGDILLTHSVLSNINMSKHDDLHLQQEGTLYLPEYHEIFSAVPMELVQRRTLWPPVAQLSREDLTKTRTFKEKLDAMQITREQQLGELVAAIESLEALDMLPEEAPVIPPPSNRLWLVHTTIQDVTSLWDFNVNSMLEATKAHNQLLRKAITKHHGYEVKSEGGMFSIAFQELPHAFAWCLDVQYQLLEAPWPDHLLLHPTCEPVRSGGRLVWKGLRVGMGISGGVAPGDIDPMTKRMEYYGPVVEKACVLAHLAQGGEILITSDQYSEVPQHLQGRVQCEALGLRRLPGLAETAEISSIVPSTLLAREFDRLREEQREHEITLHNLEQSVVARLDSQTAEDDDTASPPQSPLTDSILSTIQQTMVQCKQTAREVELSELGPHELAFLAELIAIIEKNGDQPLTIQPQDVQSLRGQLARMQQCFDNIAKTRELVTSTEEVLSLANMVALKKPDLLRRTPRKKTIQSRRSSARVPDGDDVSEAPDDDAENEEAKEKGMERSKGSSWRGKKASFVVPEGLETSSTITTDDDPQVRLHRTIATVHKFVRTFTHCMQLFIGTIEGDTSHEMINEEGLVQRLMKVIPTRRRSFRSLFSDQVKLAVDTEQDEDNIVAAGNFTVLLRSIPAHLCKTFMLLKSYFRRAHVRDTRAALRAKSITPSDPHPKMQTTASVVGKIGTLKRRADLAVPEVDVTPAEDEKSPTSRPRRILSFERRNPSLLDV